MRTITLEEHFVSPGFLAGPGKGFIEQLRSQGRPRSKGFSSSFRMSATSASPRWTPPASTCRCSR